MQSARHQEYMYYNASPIFISFHWILLALPQRYEFSSTSIEMIAIEMSSLT